MVGGRSPEGLRLQTDCIMVGEGTEVMSGVLYFVCVGLRVRSGGYIEDQGERWKVTIM